MREPVNQCCRKLPSWYLYIRPKFELPRHVFAKAGAAGKLPAPCGVGLVMHCSDPMWPWQGSGSGHLALPQF